METLNIAGNLVSLRRKKGITQEELAAFLGVTKASVSKWETRQTYPDLLLLPKLASYFDVSVDELLGYQPQLSREQIRTYYQQLAAAFAEEPFEKVMEKSRELVKKYYSCHLFLLQMAILWLNHVTLAKNPARRKEIRQEILDLCSHIIEECTDVNLCNDALGIRAFVELQAGNAQAVVEALEERLDPTHINRMDALLVQAYMMLGDVRKAEERLQVNLYQNIQEMISDCQMLLNLHRQDWERFKQILTRADRLMETFDVTGLNPNTAANYYFFTAVSLCGYGKEEEAFERVEQCVRALKLLAQEKVLHGDAFFDRLDAWFENLDLGTGMVRNPRLVMESAAAMLKHPAFAVFKNQAQLKHWQRELEEIKRAYDTKSEKNI